MSVDYNGTTSNRHPARRLEARGGGPDRLRKGQDWPKCAVCIAAAASLVTALSTLQFIGFQTLPLHAGAFIVAIAVVGVIGILAGLFSYIAVRVVDSLAGQDLSEVLTGAEPISIRWLYLPVLGLVIGGGVALFTGLAVVLLLPPLVH